MGLLTTKKMEQPISDPVNWNVLLNTIIYVGGGLVAWFYFVHWYFKNKAQEKENWIKQVATTAVNAAMDSCLKDVREDIKVLFKYREEDRKHIDHKFDGIMTEIRK